jgi:putative transposase
LHHLVARGRDGARIFADDADRATYLELLAAIAQRQTWRVLAYCLLGNHTHLLVEAPRRRLRAGTRRLRWSHEHAMHLRHGRHDALWEPPARPVLIRGEPQLWAAAAYIAVNPVEAGLCHTPSAWRWSSHAALTGELAPPPWLDVARLLELLGGGAGADAAARRYARYVAERQARGRPRRLPRDEW